MLAEEQISPRGRWKTEIRQREDGNFQVLLFRWNDEVVPDYGRVASFWSEMSAAVSVTDTLDAARRVADELLRTQAHNE